MKYHLAIKKNELDLRHCSGQIAIVSLWEKRAAHESILDNFTYVKQWQKTCKC